MINIIISGGYISVKIHCFNVNYQKMEWAHLDLNQGPTGYEPVPDKKLSCCKNCQTK